MDIKIHEHQWASFDGARPVPGDYRNCIICGMLSLTIELADGELIWVDMATFKQI